MLLFQQLENDYFKKIRRKSIRIYSFNLYIYPFRQNCVWRTSLRLCNAKGRPLPASWGRPLPTYLGRRNMTSWGCPNITSWGRPYTVLYITQRDVPYRYLEDVSCRHYEDVTMWSNMVQGTCPTDVLMMSLWFYK